MSRESSILFVSSQVLSHVAGSRWNGVSTSPSVYPTNYPRPRPHNLVMSICSLSHPVFVFRLTCGGCNSYLYMITVRLV